MEVLVEEPSAHCLLNKALGGWIGADHVQVGIRKFRGKPDLLDRLPVLMAGYARQRREGKDVRVVVLVDKDEDDCRKLKTEMDAIARRAGMVPDGVSRCVVNRIAVRELENWYFGDWEAVCAAFPKVRSKVPAPYSSTPDATAKKTSEVFERVLRQNGIRNSSKPDWAERMAPKMVPSRNRSVSFRVFIEGVRRLVEQS
ncbi:DUF4276 family protein [Thermobifida halotolerans]|uniref:DUF4276 family protein n=1 Tax=Thermobifida halotolerans TaxID=483545 RepID=UPI000EC57AFA|nr:DUF4276 family protein [Thermobifida halotolerans]